MSSQEPELDALIDALRSDVPTERERERLRARVLAAGVAVSAAAAVTSAGAVAKASAVSGGTLNGAGTAAGAKLAGMSLAAKLGWSTVVIASASALSLAPQWYATRDAKPRPSTAPAHDMPSRQLARTAVAPPPAVPFAPEPVIAAPAPAAVPEPARLRASRVAQPLRTAPNDVAPAPAVPASVEAAPEPAVSGQAKPKPSVLGAEAELIERALAALHDRDSASARRLLAAHAQRFPDGALRRERARLESQLDDRAVETSEPNHLGGNEHD